MICSYLKLVRPQYVVCEPVDLLAESLRVQLPTDCLVQQQGDQQGAPPQHLRAITYPVHKIVNNSSNIMLSTTAASINHRPSTTIHVYPITKRDLFL